MSCRPPISTETCSDVDWVPDDEQLSFSSGN
jgi:hypothetical protein